MARRYVPLLLCLAIFNAALNLAGAAGQVPAIFIFGDSTADVGTNNYLNSTARADNPYNGIDYPHSKPTGRFSNGLNSADHLVRELGDYTRSPPPFLYLVNRSWSFQDNILRGVNFASGGSGIFNGTGCKVFGDVISIGQQVQQFATVSGNITRVLGPDAAHRLISNSLYLISVGSNDLFDFQRFNSSSFSSRQALLTNLQGAYATHLQDLYNLGARKFGIISVPPIGCCPAERALNASGDCMSDMNELALASYTSTQAMLQNFSACHTDVKYALGNAYHMTMNIIENHAADGFQNSTAACCGDGLLPCKEGAYLCDKRDDYLFWDWFHPTTAASRLAALTLVYSEDQEFVAPINFSQLAAIDID